MLCFLKLLLGLRFHPSISSWLFSFGLVIMEKWTFIFSLELSHMDKWVAATRMCVLGVLGCYLLLCAGWPRRSLCVPGKRLCLQHSAQGLAWSWCSVTDCGINHWIEEKASGRSICTGSWSLGNGKREIEERKLFSEGTLSSPHHCWVCGCVSWFQFHLRLNRETIYSFMKYYLSAWYIPGFILGRSSSPHEADILLGGQTVTKARKSSTQHILSEEKRHGEKEAGTSHAHTSCFVFSLAI